MKAETLALAVHFGEPVVQRSLRAGTYARASLPGAVFSEVDLSAVDFRQADLREADFSLADLRGADLRGATLLRTRLHRARLEQAQVPAGAPVLGDDPERTEAELWRPAADVATF